MERKRKFSRELFLAYARLVFVLLLLLFIGIFLVLYNDRMQSEISSQKEFVQKTQQQVDTSLQNMDRIINGLLYNESFMQIMRSGSPAASYTKNSNEIMDMLVSLDAPQFLSHRIIAFTGESYFTFTKTGEDQTRILSAIKNYGPYDELIAAAGDKVILPVHADPFGMEGVPVYSVARTVNDGINVFGIIEVQNSYKQLEALCAVSSRLGKVALFSDEGDVVYPQENRDDEKFFRELYGVISKSPSPAGSFQRESRQITYSVSDYSGWITVMYCPLMQMAPSADLAGLFLIGFAAALLAALWLVQMLAKRVTAPLSELNTLINGISYDNLSLPESAHNIEEIESINHSFRAMLNQLEVEIAQNAQAQANEERANYIALQSLMNPHTIYNTIAMIESVCYMNGDHEAAELCIAFSQMLRYISDNTRTIYTVEDELGHLENYAALMKKRYEGRLQIIIAADKALLRENMPKFTLQPLVENAVKHGMNRHCVPFKVWVKVEETPKGWGVCVSDNGNGFTPQKIEEVYSQFAYCDRCITDNKNDILKMKIDNMALNNIYIRWKIMKGKQFDFLIQNLKPSGCSIELIIKEERGVAVAADLSGRG